MHTYRTQLVHANRRHKLELAKRVQRAVLGLSKCHFSACFVRFDVLLAAGELKPHEQV